MLFPLWNFALHCMSLEDNWIEEADSEKGPEFQTATLLATQSSIKAQTSFIARTVAPILF